MVVSGTLFTYADSFRGHKCRIAAAYGNADIKVVDVNANDKSAKHVPNFVSTDKKVKLFEDTAIAYYLANEQLRGGKSVEDQAQVLQWLAYGRNELASAVASTVYPALSLVDASASCGQRAHADLKECFAFLDAHLKTRTFLASERLTLADIAVACELTLALQHVADAAFRAPFGNVVRWWQTVVAQEHFKKVAGDITMCDKPATFCANKWSENKSKQSQACTGGDKDKKKAEKADKPKAEPKAKAAEKPTAAAAAAGNDEEDEENFDDDGPKNDPFAAMPKGTFNVDEFKRTYSNEDTHKVAMPYFFKNFDRECYSVWLCEYKYPEELTQTFMTCNLIGGMFQRIEKLRKNAFASMCVWGENNNNTIAGIWFWKGQELCFPLCNDWTTDYDTYTWRKMNLDDEAEKQLITHFFAWEGDFKGKKFNCGKIFK